MQIILDGKPVSVESGEVILDVAQRVGIDIPVLCRLPGLQPPPTSCLVCLVKVNGQFVPSCATNVEEGMVIESETEAVLSMRRSALELLLSDHIGHCRTCGQGRKKCRLLKYMVKYRANRHRFDNSEVAKCLLLNDRVTFDSSKCIKCGICIAVTRKNGVEIGLTFLGRGFDTHIGVPFGEPLHKAIKQSEDEIISTCPTAAFTWRD